MEHGSRGDERGDDADADGGDPAENGTAEGGNGDLTVAVGDVENGFYVEDDGPGIPAAEREGVFEAGNSTKKHGTGLGLAIVARIVDAHDWEVAVTEGADGGARFEITGVEFYR